MTITIYTDGACSGNPGPGGWGAVLIEGDDRRELSGGAPATTNNRMEMQAAIEALAATQSRASVILYTDSQYLKNGITQWMAGWKRNGWKTAAKKPVKNQDLWIALDDLVSARNVEWRWVKGHSGHPEYDRADALARSGVPA